MPRQPDRRTSRPQTSLTVPQGGFELHRHPDPGDATLRAWDAADEFLLQHLEDPAEADPEGRQVDAARLDGRWLVVNDAFGALAVALAAQRPSTPLASWSDSHLAHLALERNLVANGLPGDAVEQVPSTQDPAGPVQVVVLKVPRTLAHLRDQLLRLRPLLAPDAVVVAGGMTKHVHTSTLDAFAEAIGPTRTTRARRKARLVLADLDPDLQAPPSPYPTAFDHDGIEVVNHANVFAREQLDQGTRVLLEHLPPPEGEVDVVDLGCGNGIVGTVAALADPRRRLLFVDESHQAVASALATHAGAVPGGEASGRVADVLDGVPDRSVDLVLCNPPFHAQGARVDHVAQAMFEGAQRVLRPGGHLVVVGNRHLGHHAALRRLGQVEVLGSTPKFVVLRVQRSA